MINYIPRAGTKAYAAVQWFQQNSGQQLTSAELAGLIGCGVNKLPALLASAETAELLAKRRVGHGYVWRLGALQIASLESAPIDETDAPAAADSFNFALWNDGELAINGAQATDSGIILNVKQTAALVAMLTNMPGYLEYLGQQHCP
jgi:hypothetical protein